MFVNFVWGAGGVGKSHFAIRKTAESESESLLITMDPSRRIFDLLAIEDRESNEAKVELGKYKFSVKRTDQAALFNQLFSKKPGNSTVQAFYNQMVEGLQDFRDYLSLIQLSDEISRSDFSSIIVDTPPFQEAIGLHRKVFNLRHFFDSGLVQLALKSTSFSLIHLSVKKIFEIARIFTGKNAADKAYDFVEWMTFHTDRFRSAATYLEKLLFSENSRHYFVMTPETPLSFLEDVESFFSANTRPHFFINRSVMSYEIPPMKNSFGDEMRSLRTLEQALTDAIQKKFPKSSIEKVPMILMGDDSIEELIRFIEL